MTKMPKCYIALVAWIFFAAPGCAWPWQQSTTPQVSSPARPTQANVASLGSLNGQSIDYADLTTRVQDALRKLENESAQRRMHLLWNGVEEKIHDKLLTDEIWHFYGGWPMELLLLYPDGSGETRRLGNNVLAGESPQIMVSAGTWMGSSPIGPEDVTYTLAGNTLTPGFEYDDYIPGFREELVSAYPHFAERIVPLTRDGETGISAV